MISGTRQSGEHPPLQRLSPFAGDHHRPAFAQEPFRCSSVYAETALIPKASAARRDGSMHLPSLPRRALGCEWPLGVASCVAQACGGPLVVDRQPRLNTVRSRAHRRRGPFTDRAQRSLMISHSRLPLRLDYWHVAALRPGSSGGRAALLLRSAALRANNRPALLSGCSRLLEQSNPGREWLAGSGVANGHATPSAACHEHPAKPRQASIAAGSSRQESVNLPAHAHSLRYSAGPRGRSSRLRPHCAAPCEPRYETRRDRRPRPVRTCPGSALGAPS